MESDGMRKPRNKTPGGTSVRCMELSPAQAELQKASQITQLKQLQSVFHDNLTQTSNTQNSHLYLAVKYM